MQAIKLYGIKNCDTVKKARRWLESNQIDYDFVDFRETGIDAKQISAWLSQLAPENIVNKRSTTWKGLSDDDKNKVLAGDLSDIIIANPTLVKRPLLEANDTFYTGFSEKNYSEIFN